MIPPIYFISSMEEPWKRFRLIEHCAARKIVPIIFDGLSGNNNGLRASHPFETDNHGVEYFVHTTQIAMALTHRFALASALSHGAREFIIAEDEACFVDGFTGKWDSLRSSIPIETNIVQLQYNAENILIEPINDSLGMAIPYPFCTGAIWWRADAARKALSLVGPLDRPFDIILIQRVYPNLNHAVAKPQLATRFIPEAKD